MNKEELKQTNEKIKKQEKLKQLSEKINKQHELKQTSEKMNKEELKQLSEKILDYRARHNLSAEKFADRCKLTLPTIYNIENEKQAPSKMTLRKILNVLEPRCHFCDSEMIYNGDEFVCTKCEYKMSYIKESEV